jgi:hypothetical protein
VMLVSMAVPAAQQWHKDGLEEVKCPALAETQPPCNCEASTDGLDFRCLLVFCAHVLKHYK